MSSTAASGSERDLKNRAQLPMLAAQRPDDRANTATGANRAPRFAQYFPLGYREAFNQWVIYYLV